MKKPRLEEFDPETKVAPLASPLEDMPSIQKSPVRQEISSTHPSRAMEEPMRSGDDTTYPYEGTPVRPFARSPGRRSITRYSFEFFSDQILSLRHFSLSEKTQGEKGSMSQMVREAVDAYIAKRNRTDQ